MSLSPMLLSRYCAILAVAVPLLCSKIWDMYNELHAPDLPLVREKDVELNVDVQISEKVETLKKSEKWGSI